MDAAASSATAHGVPTLRRGGPTSARRRVCSASPTTCADRLGRTARRVANAGVLGPVGPLHLVDLDDWATAVGIDLVGVANTLAVFGALMVGAGRGSLVTMSGGGVGGPNMATALSAYTCSKAAVVALTETVAGSWRRTGFASTLSRRARSPPGSWSRCSRPARPSPGTSCSTRPRASARRPDSLDAFDAVLRFLSTRRRRSSPGGCSAPDGTTRRRSGRASRAATRRGTACAASTASLYDELAEGR